MFDVHHVRLNEIEPENHYCNRPKGTVIYDYFFYFYTSIEYLEDGKWVRYNPGTVLISTIKEQCIWRTVDNNRLNHSFFDFTLFDESYLNGFDLQLNKPFLARQNKKIEERLKKIKEYHSSTISLKEKLLDREIIDLLICVSESLHFGKNKNQIGDNNLQQHFDNCRIELFQNPEKFNVERFAQLVGYSTSRIAFYYQMFYKTNILKDIELAKKEKLIQYVDKKMTLEQAAKLVGFANPYYFDRWFKKQFGISFGKYKSAIFKN